MAAFGLGLRLRRFGICDFLAILISVQIHRADTKWLVATQWWIPNGLTVQRSVQAKVHANGRKPTRIELEMVRWVAT